MDAAQNDQAHNAPSAPQSLAARLYGSNPWCCLDSPVSIPSRGPTDYQGSWHRITQAHPRQLSYAAIAFRNLRQPLETFFLPGEDFARCTQPPTRRADAALQIRTLPDTTLLMLLGSRTCLPQMFFLLPPTWQGNSSFQGACTKEGGDGSQAAHTSCVESEEDFVFGHSSPFNGLMDKITDAW